MNLMKENPILSNNDQSQIDIFENNNQIISLHSSSKQSNSKLSSLMEEELLEQQTVYSHSDLTLTLKKDSFERESKNDPFSDTDISSCGTFNTNLNAKSKSKSIKKKENKKISSKDNQNNVKFQNNMKSKKNKNSKKNKRELRCKTILIQEEEKCNAHRLDFDFIVFDSLKYAENQSPLSMAHNHKSIESFEMLKKEKLLTVHLDSLEVIKTPITLILKKLVSDSHSSAKELCDSLYYFHKLHKRFRMIRENNTDKINIYKQLMPILPNHQTPEQVLASDPKYPSLTATYKINAKKGTINLDKYTFNLKLAHLLGFPTLDLLQQHIQLTKRIPSLSVPEDYYSYITECLLNKFERQRSSVCKGFIKTFDGIKVNITEKLVSRCHIDSDITPEMINAQKRDIDIKVKKECKIEEEDNYYVNKQQNDEDDDDENDDENSPQGILYVMTKHFFFIDNPDISDYIFSKERLDICASIDYSSLIQDSLPHPQNNIFNQINPSQQNNKFNKNNLGEKPRKKINQAINTQIVKQNQIKQEFTDTIDQLQPNLNEIKIIQNQNENLIKHEDIMNIHFNQQKQEQIDSPQLQSNENISSIQHNNQIQNKNNIEEDIQQYRCSFRLITPDNQSY